MVCLMDRHGLPAGWAVGGPLNFLIKICWGAADVPQHISYFMFFVYI